MSKIFEALQGARGGWPSSLPRQLAEQLTQPAGNKGSTEQDEPSCRDNPPAETVPPTVVRTVQILPPRGALTFPFEKSHAGVGEQYRMIRTRILQNIQAPKIILISSPDLGDGKTVSAINIAGALALKSHIKVLLLDADLRRPAVAKTMGIPQSPGLTEVLQDKCSLGEAIIRVEQSPNVYVLPAGGEVSSHAELLDSPTWKAVCTTVRSQFDFTIVDAPPIDGVADYRLIQDACDYAVLIVRPDHTNRVRCLNAFKIVPAEKLIGTVLNAVPDWFLLRNSHYHHYGYYAYSAEVDEGGESTAK